MGKDYYDILGVQKDAAEADVKKVTITYDMCTVIIQDYIKNIKLSVITILFPY